MPCGFDPIRQARVFVRHHDANGAIGFELRGVFVDMDIVEAVVQRLHPVVVELKVPGVAFGGRRFDHERLFGTQVPIRVEVTDVWITPCSDRRFVVELRQLVRVSLEALRP